MGLPSLPLRKVVVICSQQVDPSFRYRSISSVRDAYLSMRPDASSANSSWKAFITRSLDDGVRLLIGFMTMISSTVYPRTLVTDGLTYVYLRSKSTVHMTSLT